MDDQLKSSFLYGKIKAFYILYIATYLKIVLLINSEQNKCETSLIPELFNR